MIKSQSHDHLSSELEVFINSISADVYSEPDVGKQSSHILVQSPGSELCRALGFLFIQSALQFFGTVILFRHLVEFDTCPVSFITSQPPEAGKEKAKTNQSGQSAMQCVGMLVR